MYVKDEKKIAKYQTTSRGGLVCKRQRIEHKSAIQATGQHKSGSCEPPHVYSFHQRCESCNYPAFGNAFYTKKQSLGTSIVMQQCQFVTFKFHETLCPKRMIVFSSRDHLYVTALTGFINGVHNFQPNHQKGSWHWKGWTTALQPVPQLFAMLRFYPFNVFFQHGLGQSEPRKVCRMFIKESSSFPQLLHAYLKCSLH